VAVVTVAGIFNHNQMHKAKRPAQKGIPALGVIKGTVDLIP
jgi:hypothetical protein